MGIEPLAWQRLLLRLEEEDGAVAEVEVDEVLCLCALPVMSASVFPLAREIEEQRKATGKGKYEP